jgi:putative ABC transport system permease protein
MKLLDLIALILDNLGRRKGRVVLTAVGVVIGTASVVLLISLAIGLQKSATSQLWGISDLRRIDVYPGYNEAALSASGPIARSIDANSGIKLLTPQTIKDLQAIPGVEMVIPRQGMNGSATMRFGRLESYPYIQGVDVDDLSVFDYPLQSGTTQLERGTAILGYWAATQFYDPKQRPGQDQPEQPDLLNQQVKLILTRWTNDGTTVTKTVTLRVVGLLSQAQAEQDSMMLVSMSDVVAWNEWFSGQRVNFNRDGYNQLVVRAASPDEVIDIADQINEMGYQASTAQSYVQGINSFFVILQIVFGGIGAISLLVAAIGIANTMTMAILERTREIGLMKAIGATNRNVLSIFLGESAGIGFVGGLGGVALGWIGGYVINVVASTYLSGQSSYIGVGGGSLTASTPVWLPPFALIFATLVGLLSGLYPSLRAASMVPVTALKYE